MHPDDFDRSVFINCPFDADFAPLLEALFFTLILLGYKPRIANEQINTIDARMARIEQIITACEFSIHDLSRCMASHEGEYYRLNMPFELGIDYGLRLYGEDRLRNKKILILSEIAFSRNIALSDLSGCDAEVHSADQETLIRRVRNWFRSQSGGRLPHANKIFGQFLGFQEWHYEKELAHGASKEDILNMPVRELLDAIEDWDQAGRPMSYN